MVTAGEKDFTAGTAGDGLAAVFGAIEMTAAEANARVDGDYIGEDGLLYCGVCKDRKQVRIVIFDEERAVPRMCKCREAIHAANERGRRAAELRQKYQDYSRTATDFQLLEWLDRHEYTVAPDLVEERKRLLKKICFPSCDMSAANFANDDRANERVSTIMQNYADNFDTMKENGKGILLYGEVGRGKSFLACCVGNALIERGIPVLMTDFERIERESSKNYNERQEYFDALNRFPLLIIDDLGVERNTTYMNSVVYTVIDNRVKAGLPIIVTTNLTAEELKNPAEIANMRIYSRLLGACLPIEVKGHDRRRDKLKEDWAGFKDILGY